MTGTGTGKNFALGTGTGNSTGFSKFLMTEYGLISIFKERKMYGLKTAQVLLRVRDGVRVIFKIEVRVRNPSPYSGV